MVDLQCHQAVTAPEETTAPSDGDQCLNRDITSQSVDADQQSTLARRWEEFRQQREIWELEHQRDVERLRREGDLLAEAWQRLESEQRKLLGERELLRRGATGDSHSIFPANGAPTLPRAAASSPGAASHTRGDDQEHTAWLQFQQLRREIQNFGSKTT